MAFLKSGQNETFGSTLKKIHGAFVPHLFPDVYIYLGSNRQIMGQKPAEKIFTRFFQKKLL